MTTNHDPSPDWVEPPAEAPDFELLDHHSRAVKLSSLRGQSVVLYFYPRDDTPGCTKQACAFRDRYQTLTDAEVVLLGVSGDSAADHVRFAEKYALPFPLLVDDDHSVAAQYGAYREKNLYGKKSMGIQRSTFVIDADGKVIRTFKRVKVDGHDEQVMKALGIDA